MKYQRPGSSKQKENYFSLLKKFQSFEILMSNLIISLTLAFCNSPEIYNYEIESDQDSEIIESKLQINTYIDDEKVEVNFQLFPKNIEKIQSYELLFDMKFRENYNSEFNGVCIGPDWDFYGPGEFSVTLKKENNFKTKLIGQIYEEVDDRCNTYYYYLRFVTSNPKNTPTPIVLVVVFYRSCLYRGKSPRTFLTCSFLLVTIHVRS